MDDVTVTKIWLPKVTSLIQNPGLPISGAFILLPLTILQLQYCTTNYGHAKKDEESA